MKRSPHLLACLAFVLAIAPYQDVMATQNIACCHDDTMCSDVFPDDCSMTLNGTHAIGGDCATVQACCSATDTGNVCDDRLPCDCVRNGGIPGAGLCADGCCGLQSGPIENAPIPFGNLQDLCNSFTGFPPPPNVVPPPIPGAGPYDDPPQSYIDRLMSFIISRQYTKLGWLHDADKARVFEEYNGTPPGGDCTRHPAMRVYYSPGVIRWLCRGKCTLSNTFCDFPGGGSCPTGEGVCEGRAGQCIPNNPGTACDTAADCPIGDICSLAPPGAMMILEERPYASITLDGTDTMWLNPTCYAEQPSRWSAMVKGTTPVVCVGGPQDGLPCKNGNDDCGGFPCNSTFLTQEPGWFWIEQDITPESKNFAFNKASCLACHNMAPSHETFADLGNILKTQVYYEHQADEAKTGACCEDCPGVCTDDVTQADCESNGRRYGGDCSECKFLDPQCSAVATGACCNNVTGNCTPNVCQLDCEGPGERFGGDGSTCSTIDPACVIIPAVSEWGLVVLTLLGCVVGTVVFRGVGRRSRLQT